MERTLHRYISLVRFNQISSLKFYIAPNKKTIINIHPPRQISQPRQSKIDSVAFVGMVGMLK